MTEEAAALPPLAGPTARYRAWWAMTVIGAMGVGIQFPAVPRFVRDRVERRRIVIRVQIDAAAVSCVYVSLSKADFSGVWPVFSLGAIIGSVDAFGQPARISTASGVLALRFKRPVRNLP